jgi:hypothetical protein
MSDSAAWNKMKVRDKMLAMLVLVPQLAFPCAKLHLWCRNRQQPGLGGKCRLAVCHPAI